MHYSPVATKIKVILTTKSLTGEELKEFFSTLKTLKKYSVKFFNPYTGETQTAKCYRGDRNVKMKWDQVERGILYNPISISLIEL